MEQKEFLKSIKACGKKLNRAETVKNLIFSLSVGAGVGILFQIIAFCTPFYRANICSLLALFLAVLTALVISALHRKSLYQAALYMDRFGFQERIVTAYEHLDEDGEMVELQRRDAMEQLRAYKERIRVPIIKSWKAPAVMTVLLLTMLLLMFMPAEMKQKAKELQQVHEEAQEKQEELKEVVEGLEELAQEESLTPEQMADLQEMLESLQSSMQEYKNADSMDMIETANQKLDYKYDNMSQQLTDMTNAIMLQSVSEAYQSLEAMQEMAEKMQELGASGQQDGATSLVENQGSTGEQSGDGQSGNQSGNQRNQGQSSVQDGQNGNQQGNGQNGQSGEGQSQGNGNNQSQGVGNGQGQGQGNGQGQSNSSGQVEGSGSGRGEGSGATPHDYVSIPNEIMDTGNLSGNVNGHEGSDYFRTQNGLSWEGNHVSHEEVIGSYEKNAYEGIAAGKYPSGMEEVIKEYFASFN